MSWTIGLFSVLATIIFFIPFIHYWPVMGTLIVGIAVLGGIVGGIVCSQQDK